MTSMAGNQGFRGPAGGNMNSFSAGNFKEKRPHGYNKASMQNFTPEQMQLFQQMFSQVSPDSYLSRLANGDQSFFDEMEAPAMRQFQQLQGQNASRFSGMGMGARQGSGFQMAQDEATSAFAQDLQSKRQLLQRQAIEELMGLSNNLLQQRPYEQFYVPKKNKGGAEAVGRAAGFIPGFVTSLTGNGSAGDAFRGAMSSMGF